MEMEQNDHFILAGLKKCMLYIAEKNIKKTTKRNSNHNDGNTSNNNVDFGQITISIYTRPKKNVDFVSFGGGVAEAVLVTLKVI
jgi:hypothetical protein